MPKNKIITKRTRLHNKSAMTPLPTWETALEQGREALEEAKARVLAIEKSLKIVEEKAARGERFPWWIS